MYHFPGSWDFVKRNIGGLVGGAIGSAVENYRLARLQAKRVAADSRVPVTWRGERPMWGSYARKYRSYNPMLQGKKIGGRRRRSYRRRYRRRLYKSNDDGYRRFVRSSNLGTKQIPVGGTYISSADDIKLSDINTGDLTGIYRLYRIRKVVLHLTPRIDPANSGLSNNFQSVVACAVDPEGAVAPTTMRAITSYDNSYQKWVNSGEQFTFTFYPKVINTVDVSGTATAAGSYGRNPWLQLSSSGITVPHKQLLVFIGIQAPATSALSFDFYWDVHFDVKGVA